MRMIFGHSCPSCGYFFNWKEKYRSTRGFGFLRKPFSCPACGSTIIWKKWPWRVALGGNVMALTLVLLQMFLTGKHSPPGRLFLLGELALVPMLAAGISLFMAHLELGPPSEPVTGNGDSLTGTGSR